MVLHRREKLLFNILSALFAKGFSELEVGKGCFRQGHGVRGLLFVYLCRVRFSHPSDRRRNLYQSGGTFINKKQAPAAWSPERLWHNGLYRTCRDVLRCCRGCMNYRFIYGLYRARVMVKATLLGTCMNVLTNPIFGATYDIPSFSTPFQSPSS